MTPARARTAQLAAIAIAILGALALRVVLEGRGALAEGDRAYAEQRPVDAIAAWEEAARWYLPGAPHVTDAYDRLREHARTRQSLPAWRAIRRAALATRGPWSSRGDELAEANAAIVELELVRSQATDPERRTWLEARLARSPGAHRGWAVVAALGLVAWIVGIFWLVRTTPEAAPARSTLAAWWSSPAIRRMRAGVLLAIAGVAVWALGLYSA
jgi:hypothetical protein